jgi:hypothetical protein
VTEKRQEARFGISGAAKAFLPGRDTPINCRVFDVSGSGCCVDLNEALPDVETFRLAPDDGHPLGYQCRVVWRQGNKIGALFED